MRFLLLLLSACALIRLPARPQSAPAGAPAPLSLDDCIRKALAVPSTVTLARHDRAIADKSLSLARASFLPAATAQGAFTYNSPSFQDRALISFVALNGIREFSALAAIFQEIDTSGRLRAEYARAKAQQTAASLSLAIAERDLKRAVAAAYYRLLLARHILDALRDLLVEAESFENRTRLLAAAGEAARADLVKASSQTALLRQSLLAAELAASLANQDLASFWTPDVTTPLSLVDSFDAPLPSPEPLPTDPAPFLSRFEFRLLDAQRQASLAQAKAARALLLPRLTWTFHYGIDANRVAWNQRGYAAFATLAFPLFDWSRARNSSRQFLLQAQQLADTRAISERRFSLEYSSALQRVHQFFQQIELCRRQIDLSRQDLQLSRVRYEGGEGAAVDVVVAQNQLAQAQIAYYTAIANYLNARLDLEVAAAR